MKLRFSHIIAVISAVLLAIPVPAQETAMRLRTVVIDPGHGGKDAGCVSRDQKTYEKNIALDIAKRLAQKISASYPDVNVKMTRSDDNFVELENRAVYANKSGADLFISVHVNAVDGSTAANGYSIHCLGQSKKKGNDLYSKNLDLVKRENSVIKLEKNYAATYQGFDPDDPSSSIIFSLMQNAHLGQSLEFAADVAQAMEGGPIKTNRGVSQDPFWVLWRTAMPAVLIEVGFMTNPQDLAVLRSEVGRDQIAQNIYKAFRIDKARYDREEIADQVGNDVTVLLCSAARQPSVEGISRQVKGNHLADRNFGKTGRIFIPGDISTQFHRSVFIGRIAQDPAKPFPGGNGKIRFGCRRREKACQQQHAA